MNYDKSAASFCCQVAAQVLRMFCSLYTVQNLKYAINSTTSENQKEKKAQCWNPFYFRKILAHVLLNCEKSNFTAYI
jgi:hypothetical protein